MSAYEAVHGPYNWNWFLLALPGCKAVIYEYPVARGSWASYGTDAWYMRPSLDHYHCNHYFVPKHAHTKSWDQLSCSHNTAKSLSSCGMRTYRKWLMNYIQRSACFLPHKGLPTVTNTTTQWANLNLNIDSPYTGMDVATRGHSITPLCLTFRITKPPPGTKGDAPFHPYPMNHGCTTIMHAPNITAKSCLKTTKRMHARCTCNNVPGGVPTITTSAPQQ